MPTHLKMTKLRRPLSISQLRTALQCGRAYKMIYLQGEKRHLSASAFYGSLIHEVFWHLYRGEAMDDALQLAWAAYCGPQLPALAQWYDLDQEYRRAGDPRSKADKDWRAGHAVYDQLLERFLRYQREHLRNYRWSNDPSIASFYRRSMRLVTSAPPRPYPVAPSFACGGPDHCRDLC